MADTKVTRSSIESANKAESTKILEQLLTEQFGACFPVKEGFAVAVGKSPLDGAMMWVVFPAPVAKSIQTHKWGKGTREYFDGAEESKSWLATVEANAKKKAEEKANSAANAERDKAARAKKKAEKEKAE